MTDAALDELLAGDEPAPQERTYHTHSPMEPHIHFHRKDDGHDHRRSPVVHE
jgi:hypothetical protein